MKNIFKEPHYGVPGMILLPFEDARNLWHEVRGKYNSKVEYTVYHWPSYWDVMKIALVKRLIEPNQFRKNFSVYYIENFKDKTFFFLFSM